MSWKIPHTILNGTQSESQNHRVFFDSGGIAHIFFWDTALGDGLHHAVKLANGAAHDWKPAELAVPNIKAPKMIIDNLGIFHVVGTDTVTLRVKHAYGSLAEVMAGTLTVHNVTENAPQNLPTKTPGIYEDLANGRMYCCFQHDATNNAVQITQSDDAGVTWDFKTIFYPVDAVTVEAVECATLPSGLLVIASLITTTASALNSNGAIEISTFDPDNEFVNPVSIYSGTYEVGTGENKLSEFLRIYLEITATGTIEIRYGYNWNIYKLWSAAEDVYAIWHNDLVFQGSTGELVRYFGMHKDQNGNRHYAFINQGVGQKGVYYYNDKYPGSTRKLVSNMEDASVWEFRHPCIALSSTGEILVGFNNTTRTNTGVIENLHYERVRDPWNDPIPVYDNVFSSLDLSKVYIDADGFAHIFFYRETSLGPYDLWYSSNATGSWVSEMVDDGSTYDSTDVGHALSDNVNFVNGQFHLTYYDWDWDAIRFCYGTSGNWNYSLVDSAPGFPNQTVCVVNPVDPTIIHVAYSNASYDLVVTKSIDSGVTWGTPEVVHNHATLEIPYTISMIQTLDQVIHIAYTDGLGGNTGWYTGGTMGSWYTTQLPGVVSAEDIVILHNMSLDVLTVLHISTADLFESTGTFGTTGVPSTVTWNTVNRTQEALNLNYFHAVQDKNGTTHVALYVGYNSGLGVEADLYYTNSIMWNDTSDSSNAGTIEGPLAVLGQSGWRANIALDIYGNLHIAYIETFDNYIVTYMNNVASEGKGDQVLLGDFFDIEIAAFSMSEGSIMGDAFTAVIDNITKRDIEIVYGIRVQVDLEADYDITLQIETDLEIIYSITMYSDLQISYKLGYLHTNLAVVSNLSPRIDSDMDYLYGLNIYMESNLELSQGIMVQSDISASYSLAERLESNLEILSGIQKLLISDLKFQYGIFTSVHSDTECIFNINNYNKIYNDAKFLYMLRDDVSERSTNIFNASVEE